jgi:hypothetical protein
MPDMARINGRLDGVLELLERGYLLIDLDEPQCARVDPQSNAREFSELILRHGLEIEEWVHRLQPLCAAYGDVIEAGPPADIPVRRWKKFTIDADNFMYDFAGRALALGWEVNELFGRDETLSSFGVVWLLDGRTIDSIDMDAARVKTPDGQFTLLYRPFGKLEEQSP